MSLERHGSGWCCSQPGGSACSYYCNRTGPGPSTQVDTIAACVAIDDCRCQVAAAVRSGVRVSSHKPIDAWFSSDSAESVKRDRHLQANDHRHSVLPNVDPVDSQDSVNWIPAPSPSANDYSLDPILCVIVLFVAISVSIGLLFRGVYSHIRFAIRLRSCRLLDDQPLIDLLLRECDSLGADRACIT